MTRTEPAAPPRVVVITMVRDEAAMLPRWVDYYGREVGLGNLVVLDDNSVDGSTTGLACPVYRLPPPPWKKPWSKTRLQLVNGMARGLLACNDVVIFTDVDEFLVPDPAKYSGLLDYVASTDTPVVAPLALELVHNAQVEPALDPARPLLQQRRFVKLSLGMCKPHVKRVPQHWDGAFHRINAEFQVDPDLLMLHLKYADVATLETVAEHRREVHEKENRGHPDSFWPMGARLLKQKLASWTNASHAPEFHASEARLHGLVQPFGDGTWMASYNQVKALEESPLRVLPARFRDAF